MAEPSEGIPPDAVRAAADVLEQIRQMDLLPTLVNIEGSPGSPDHYIVNIDVVESDHEPAEHPDAMQRVLNDITSEHADELVVAAPEAPMYPEEHGAAYWDLDAMIRIQPDPDL